MFDKHEGLTFDRNLRRLDVFLGVGGCTEEVVQLIQRRLLGVIQGVTADDDVDLLLQEYLSDLNFFEIGKNPKERLLPILKRFFGNDTVEVKEVYEWFDRGIDLPKPNVLVIRLNVSGEQRICYLKYMDEGPRRECLGMRINNLLTDSPVPFMASGYTALQMEIRGIGFDEHQGFTDDENFKTFVFNVGKADEFGRLIHLGDRKAIDLLVCSTRVSQIDFGASFSRYEPLDHFVSLGRHRDLFEAGRLEARRIIDEKYTASRELVDALLARVDDSVVDLMNLENKRNLFPIAQNPRDIVRKYLNEIGL